MIDLRSDTITRPTAGMRQAMAAAEVGDDVFGDDPTVNRLQEEVAALLGKEAALYVPSGTMGNQLAVKAQTRPGDQVVLEQSAHIHLYEAGAPAFLSGVTLSCVAGRGGVLGWDHIEAALNPADVHSAPPRLVCLENTHNKAGGRIYPQDLLVDVAARAHGRGLRVHLDGARLWNAHTATGLALVELTAPVDSVSVCFSKALGAPIGSVLAGNRDTIRTAHRFRKMWGGAMRQVGVLAAACRYALEHHLPLLAADHARARRLVDELANDLLRPAHPVETNIVILEVVDPGTGEGLLAHLHRRDVLAVGFGPGRVRLIPHLDITDEQIDAVVAALNDYRGEGS